MKRFSQLTQTATEADLVAGNFSAIDVPGVGGATKKMPAEFLENFYYIDLNQQKFWEVGTINQSTGEDYASTSALRTCFIPLSPFAITPFTKAVGVGFNFFVYCYNSNGGFIARISNADISSILETYPTARLFRIALNGITGTSVSVANIANIITFIWNVYAFRYVFRDEMNYVVDNVYKHISQLMGNSSIAIDLNEQAYWEVGAFNTSIGAPIDSSNALRSRFLRLTSNSSIAVAKAEGVSYNRRTYLYDKDKVFIAYSTETSVATILESYPTAVYYRMAFTGIAGATVTVSNIANIFTWSAGLYEVVLGIDGEFSDIKHELDVQSFQNVLKGKKWYACGDSFTEGNFSSITPPVIPSGKKYAGKKPVYPYLIGNRTDADVRNIAVSGSTIAQPSDASFENVFTRTSTGLLYTTDFSDADYITLYFGINDSHKNIPIGTIDDADNSTFYGAWNVAIDYLTTNYPNARVGIIISNGCDSADYPTATKNIAEKWGLNYLDLDGGVNCQTMLRCSSRNPASATIKARRLEQYKVSATNQHPNALAHEIESTFIEAWLRSL